MSNSFAPPTIYFDDFTVERGSPLKAILLALAVDFGGTLLSAVLIGMIYAISLISSGTSEDYVAVTLQNVSPNSWPSVAGAAVCILFSVLGGFVCARVAKHAEYKLGGVVAAISIAVGLWMENVQLSVLMNVFSAVITTGAVMFGVRLGIARNAAG
ncbi:hypothetical protein [Methylocaldum szegediense]|uniref:Uncharacterized protein n=1 Tax=Methylocaldum szegediense TaxID=73780 RepID=A0ABM9HZP6_9GAMM|nr:hypothetical protein [Methylocaldum szegediense]CAI8793610.1 conserved membrane protein of unknown function [Methylocaldum szegediense]